jgi:hypothetical protein
MNKIEKENLGIWFLPSNPTERLSGTLIIDDDNGCELKMAHNFGGFSGIGIDNLPVIHGILSNGKKVTLIDSTKTNQQWAFPGFPVTILSCRLAVIGGFYQDEKDIIISEMKATYEHLNFWLNKNPFEIISRQNEIYMNYKMPEVIKSEIGNLGIEFTYRVSATGDQYSKFELTQTEFVRFLFKENTHYRAAIDEVYDFSSFLTLCIGKKVDNKNFYAKDIDGNDIILLFKLQMENSQKIREHDIFIKFSYIEETFETCLQAWNAKKALLEPIIIYFVEAHERGFHVPLSFLKVVQAIEAFSRRMRNNKIWTEEEFNEKVDRIVAQLQDDEDKKLISGILSNEPRLRQRLTDLFAEVNDIFEISSKKRKSYTNKIVDTRNYFTHFDEALKPNVLDVDMMYYLTGYLKLVLRVLLLRELGMDNDLIKCRMIDSQELLNIKEGLGLIPPVELMKIEIKDVTEDDSKENSTDSTITDS